jgi:D-alanyl-D-alanine carboxypeptidase
LKKFWTKVLFYLLAIWTISAAYSAIVTSRQATTIRFDDKPGTFQLLLDSFRSSTGPNIKSKSAIVVDLDNGAVLLKKDEEKVMPIASLTKLASALVFLNTSPDLLRIETVTRDDREGAGRSRLYVGEKVTDFDLFHLMLISSDNVAARILARGTGLMQDQFVAKMNELASTLNLTHTHFADPTGLDPANVSTAAECAILFKTALDNDFIAETVSKKNHTFRAINSERNFVIYNTNRLLYGRPDVIGGKTGYIKESGYCLALGVEDEDGRKLAAVLLGAPTSGGRFRDAARLLTSIGEATQTSY